MKKYLLVLSIIIAIGSHSQTIEFQPSSQTVGLNEAFSTDLNIVNVQNLGGFELEIDFDPALLEATSVTLGGFLGSTGRTVFPLSNNIDNVSGLIEFAVTTLGADPPAPNGSGLLLSIEWLSTDNLSVETTTDLILQNVQVTEPNGTLIPVTLQNGSVTIVPPVTDYLTVTPPNQDVGYSAGTTTFSVSSNITWSVSDDASWLTVSPTSGSDDGTLTATYTENTGVERMGTITVSGSGVPDEIVTVTQDGALYLTVTPPNQDVGYSAGTTTFSVSSNITWSVSDDASWLTVSPTSGSDDGTLTATYTENTGVERIGSITVSGSGVPDEIVTVTQDGALYLTVTPPNQDVGYSAGTTTFSVSSNITWNVSDDAPWLTVTPTSGSDNGTLTATYTENTGGERVGTITVSGSGVPNETVTVTQSGVPSNAIISFNPSSQTVNTSTNFTTELNISSVQNLGGFELEINFDPSLLEATSVILGGFLGSTGRTVFPLANNIDNVSGLIEFAVTTLGASPPGPDGDGLLLTIQWLSTDNLGATDLILQNVQVTEPNGTLIPVTLQNGSVTIVPPTDYLTVTPPNQDVGYAAGSTTFSVSSNITWSVSDDAGWLTVTPTSGNDDGTLTATYTENTGVERIGIITVSGSGVSPVSVTVTQDPAPSSYLDVTPSNRDVVYAAGSTTFSVSSNITWSVSDDAGWLTVTPTSGSDNGTLTATYTENTGGQRVGTITVSGSGVPDEIVTVTQDGVPSNAIISFNPSSQTVNTSTSFTTELNISSVQNLGGFELEIDFDPSLLEATSVTLGGFLGSTGRTVFPLANNIDNVSGLIEFAVTTLGADPPGPNGDGLLLTIEWLSTDNLSVETTTDLILQNVQVTEPNGTLIPVTLQNGSVTIVVQPYLNVTPPNRDVPYAAGTTTFSVSSNITWNVSDDASWLTVTPPSGSDNGTLTATYTENTGGERVGTITVSGGGITPVSVTVTQEAACYLIISPPNQVVGYAAGTTTFTVSSNTMWSVSDDATWLTVTPTSGSDNGTLTVTYTENTGVERIGTITVSSSCTPPVIVTVTQEEAPYLIVTPPNQDVGYAAGTTTFSVSSNITWNVSDDASWLTVTPTSGSDNGTLTATFTENTGGQRVGTITVSGSGVTAVNVTVTQAALDPPPAPILLTATAQSSTQIEVSWENVTGEDGYNVYRALSSGGTYTPIGTTGSDVTTYSDNGLTPGTEYCYKVKAYNGAGESGYSPYDCETTPDLATILTTAGSVEGCSGSFVIPIQVANIEDVYEFTLTLNFDENEIGYSNIQNIHIGLSIGDFETTPYSGQLVFTWTSDDPLTIDSGVLFELLFESETMYEEIQSNLVWNVNNGNCQYLNGNGTELPADFNDGLIIINPNVGGINNIIGPIDVYTYDDYIIDYFVPPVDNTDYYEWSLSPDNVGYIVENSNEATVVYDTEGPMEDTAYIQVSAGNNCNESFSNILEVYIHRFPGGIHNTKLRQHFNVKVFPNPSKGLFNIKVNNAEDDVTVNIFNFSGSLSYKEKVIINNQGIGTKQLNMIHYPRGIYYLKFVSANSVVTKKVVIQ